VKKTIGSLLALSATSLFAYTDADLDGVEDKYDKCPNTQFYELVDLKGCSIQTLSAQHHFDIIMGAHYSEADYDALEKTDTYSGSVQVDYYYKNFAIQASTSYYSANSNTYNDNGLDNSYLGASYTFALQENLSMSIGAGLIIPTYDSSLKNNNTDFTGTLNFSYMLDTINLFGGYGYTLINDDDIPNTVIYQNSSSYSFGVGVYATEKLYLSGAYNSSKSIYAGVKSIDTANLYGYYSLNENWFTTLGYVYGLSQSASDNALSLKVGYYF
jgi:hypothetical protein